MADDVQGQVPNDGGQEPQVMTQSTEGQEPEEEAFDRERALATIRKLRESEKVARQYAKELETLRAQVRQQEEAKLSETERLQKRLAELEREQATYQRERQERTLKYEVMLAASRMGIVDPEAAYKLLDLASIEFEEDGTPKNVEKALRELIAKRPYLASAAAGSATNPARSAVNPPVFTRSQLRDPKFFQAHRDAIMQAMREGRIVEE